MLSGRSVRTYLALLLLVAILPLAVVLGYDTYVRAADDEHQLALRAFQTAERMADNTERFVAESKALIEKIAGSAAKYVRDPSQCPSLSAVYVGLPPIYANITIADHTGQMLCSAREADLRKLPSFGGHEYIQRLLRENQPTLSPPLIGLISHRWSVFFAQPIHDEEHRIIGIAILPVDLLGLQFVATDRSALPGTIARIFDNAGVLIASSEDPAQWIGRNARDTEAVAIAIERKEGTVSAIGLRGIARMHGFSPVSDTDWIAYTSVPADPVYSETTRRVFRNLAITMLAICVVGALLVLVARAIARPILQIASVAKQVSAGNTHVRLKITGPAEIARVADQVNRMLDQQSKVERELRASEQRLQLLSGKLLNMQEEERKKLARDLHDRVGQVLAALKMKLGVIRRHSHEEGVASKVDECIEGADRLSDEVRGLTQELRPPQLEELGLSGALRVYVERYAQSARLSCHYSAPDTLPALPPVTEVSCFRIAQEALTNVLRHSSATSVWVELAVEGGTLHLTVRDDGGGFDSTAVRERVARGDSTGLISMEERAALVGGSVDISTASGVGTTVHAILPMSGANEFGIAAGA